MQQSAGRLLPRAWGCVMVFVVRASRIVPLRRAVRRWALVLVAAIVIACSTSDTDADGVPIATGVAESSPFDFVRARTSMHAGGWIAKNARLSLQATVDARQIQVLPLPESDSATAKWAWSMRLAEFGRVGALRPARERVPTASGARIEYARGDGWTEWYESGAPGVEQGFTVRERPRGDGALQVELAWSGSLRAIERAERIDFVDDDGKRVLSYGKLTAYDARERALPARMSLRGDRIRIEVEDADAVYPIVIDPLMWAPHATLRPAKPRPGANFGCGAALDGDTAVIGACSEDTNAGSAYVFVRTGDTWSERQRLVASDAAPGAYFGSSISLRGDTAVIGAPNGSTNVGAAYVFTRLSGTWTEGQKLAASGSVASDWFGSSSALSSDTLVVGAPTSNARTGAAYVYARDRAKWVEQRRLTASSGGDGDGFGAAVGVSGSTILVGAVVRSAVYVFESDGGAWNERETLAPASSASAFGGAIGFSGNRALIGASAINRAFLFDRVGSVWQTPTPLVAAGGESDLRFGYTVALSENYAIVTASGARSGGASATFFSCQAAGCIQTQRYTSVDNAALLINAVPSISGDWAILGVRTVDNSSGAAYVESHDRFGNADACSTRRDCVSGVCSDGVCCDIACDGPCVACDVPDKRGTCSPVSGAPHGTRTCGGFTCSRDPTPACRTTCNASSDCMPGFECDANRCVQGARCTDDRTASLPRGSASAPITCTPYRCGANGACVNACATTDDCAGGFACRFDSKVCEALVPTAPAGCTVSGADSTSAPAEWLFASALAALLRRRQRRVAQNATFAKS